MAAVGVKNLDKRGLVETCFALGALVYSSPSVFFLRVGCCVGVSVDGLCPEEGFRGVRVSRSIVVVVLGWVPSREDYWHVRRGAPSDTCFALSASTCIVASLVYGYL